MDIVGIAMAVFLGMLSIALLAMLAFSVRSVISGKHDLKKILTMFVPFAVFGVAFVVLGSAEAAGILTMLVMLGVLALFIAYSGLRRSFK